MSQKSWEQRCVIKVIEFDGLRNEGPWSNKGETLFVDLMDREDAKGNWQIIIFTKTSWNYIKKPTKC